MFKYYLVLSSSNSPSGSVWEVTDHCKLQTKAYLTLSHIKIKVCILLFYYLFILFICLANSGKGIKQRFCEISLLLNLKGAIYISNILLALCIKPPLHTGLAKHCQSFFCFSFLNLQKLSCFVNYLGMLHTPRPMVNSVKPRLTLVNTDACERWRELYIS